MPILPLVARALLAIVTAGSIGGCAASARPAAVQVVTTQPVDSALGVATFDTAWQRIADTHYDTAYGGVDWLAVRDELRPRAAAARDNDQLRQVVRTMLGRLGESHFALIPREASAVPDDGAESEPGRDGAPRIQYRLIGDQVVVTRVDSGGAAYAAGIRPGWVLLQVGAQNVNLMVRGVRDAGVDLTPRMERMHVWALVTRQLSGPVGSHVELTLLDARDRQVRMLARREASRGEVVSVLNLPPIAARLEHERRAVSSAEIGVIRFNIWLAPIAAAFARAMDDLRDADGIILDLRGNPGGLGAMAMGISGHFLDTALSLGTMRTRSNELRFVSNPQRVNAAGERVRPYAGPLVILVDELSVSTSEIFAAGMQAIGRARIVGDTTTGQALPARTARLPNGDVLMHAIADLLDPRGERIEGRGVIPDVQIAPDRRNLLAGRDVTLDVALQLIADSRTGGGDTVSGGAPDR